MSELKFVAPKPNPQIQEVLEQNRMILEMNAALIRTLANPPLLANCEEDIDELKHDLERQMDINLELTNDNERLRQVLNQANTLRAVYAELGLDDSELHAAVNNLSLACIAAESRSEP